MIDVSEVLKKVELDYFELMHQIQELNLVLEELKDVKETIKHKYEVIETRRDMKEETLHLLKSIMINLGFEPSLFPY